MEDINEVPVVEAVIEWTCPACDFPNDSKAVYRCFTRFVTCQDCGLKAIPNTEDQEPN